MPRLELTSQPKRKRRTPAPPVISPLRNIALSVYTWPGTLGPTVSAHTPDDLSELAAEMLFSALAREICDRLGIADLRDAAA